MSFENLISSPKAIGALALGIGLSVFGVIYMLFDTELREEGITVEAVIRDQRSEINHYHSQIQYYEEQLEQLSTLTVTNHKYETLRKANQARSAELASAAQTLEKLQASLPQLQKSLENYKDTYRTQVRGQAVGEQVPELVTRAGALYKRVEIREVTPVGIQIRHEDGQKRIGFEDLPEPWQVRFQFDPKEKEKALAIEASRQAEEEKAIRAANEARLANREAAKERQEVLERERLNQLIATKETEIRNHQLAIRSLEAEISRDDAGRPGLRNPGKMKDQLEARKAALANVRREVAALKAQR